MVASRRVRHAIKHDEPDDYLMGIAMMALVMQVHQNGGTWRLSHDEYNRAVARQGGVEGGPAEFAIEYDDDTDTVEVSIKGLGHKEAVH